MIPLGDDDSEDPGGDEAAGDHPDLVDDPEEELLPEPGSSLRGRHGLRTGSQAGSSDGAASAGKRSATAGNRPSKANGAKEDDGKARAQRRPRGNLPPAPVFDGDRRKDVKCFWKYAAKVDSYVEIAKNIIDDSEIGLRLHAALEGEAAELLGGHPGSHFRRGIRMAGPLEAVAGQVRREADAQGGVRDAGFLKLNLNDRQYTMLETADAMDRAARRCREANLVIPDEIMI